MREVGGGGEGWERTAVAAARWRRNALVVPPGLRGKEGNNKREGIPVPLRCVAFASVRSGIVHRSGSGCRVGANMSVADLLLATNMAHVPIPS
jgi:hypothetical protein